MDCETQWTVNEWAERTFGLIDARGAFLRCAEEFAELADALGFDGVADQLYGAVQEERDCGLDPGDFDAEPCAPKARVECADVLITLYRVMHLLGGHLNAAVDDKMAINRSRKWNVKDGIGYHVKETP